MSKRLFILLAILLTLTLITACGGGGTAEVSPEAPAEQEAATEPAPAPAPTEAEAPAEAEAAAGASASDQLDQDASEEAAEPATKEPAAEEEAEAPPVETEPAGEAATGEHAADIGTGLPAGGTALTAQEAYAMALEKALAWQPDAVLIEMSASLLGPMDAEGRSTSWSVSFWAPGANELQSMLFVNGALTGTPLPNTGFPKPVPAMEQVILDTKRLYDIASAAGGSEYTAQGNNLMPGLTVYPLDEAVPTWYFNYFNPNDNTVVYTVIIDARSGEVIQTASPE